MRPRLACDICFRLTVTAGIATKSTHPSIHPLVTTSCPELTSDILLTTGAQITNPPVCLLVIPLEGKRAPFKVGILFGFAYSSKYSAVIPASVPCARVRVLFIKFNINTPESLHSPQRRRRRRGPTRRNNMVCTSSFIGAQFLLHLFSAHARSRTPTHCERVAIDTPQSATQLQFRRRRSRAAFLSFRAHRRSVVLIVIFYTFSLQLCVGDISIRRARHLRACTGGILIHTLHTQSFDGNMRDVLCCGLRETRSRAHKI